jgi:iron complex outermembrane recepter protein
MKPANSSARWFVLVALFMALIAAASAAEATATITGNVSNVATRNLLEGAKVEVPQLGLSALTDNTGRFVLTGVPPGTHEIVASYLGLDTTRAQVTVAAGQRIGRDFDLTAGIYTLEAFKVTGEREGDALAITAQRNADNVKNIVAMDSFGNLPNMSAGEVVMRLPGIAGNPTDEGLAYEFSVRGMAPGLNTVTVDGGLLPSIGASRSFQLQSITGAMFEQLELIKGHTPDKGADSLGGTINMKTRSPLNMREKRRISYSASVRVAPSFLEQVPLREQHRAHPLINLGYQEVFDVFGGARNLGVAVNLFYSENAVGGFRTDRDYQNTLNEPAYVWSYRTWDNYNNRKQSSLNVKTDYRYSFNSKFTFSFTINDNIEKFRRVYQTRAFTGTATTVPNATTSGVIPGFTNRITEVRPVASSVMDIMTSGPNNYMVQTYQFNVGGEHEFGRLKLDYTAGGGRNKLWNGTGVGYLTNRVSNIGWILDRTDSDLHPRFIQTAGPDITDYANYRPIANGLTRTPNNNIQEIRQARVDALYSVPIRIPLSLKTGLVWREQEVNLKNFSRRWSYLGTTALAADPSIVTYDSLKTGRRLPMWEVAQHTKDGEPTVPSLWREDLYYAEQIKYTGTRGVTEGVTAGYFMAQGRFGQEGWLGRTGFLAGVRRERTDTESYGWVRARFASTAAQQVADPVGTAERDYAGTRRDSKGSYSKSFPSVHLTHDVTRNLKARLSWSTSFGRPSMSSLMPNETVNEANDTVTINNPSLLPQMADNWDATLEYYFEPVGSFSVGWFHKSINDYIVSGISSGIVPGGADNGYNGEYEGFTRLTSANAGTAIVQGWEFSYQQQFTFLPGLLRGLSGSMNYTIIDTHGDFGGAAYRRTGEVAGFIPKAGNVSLSWRFRGFSTRVLYNFTGEHITSYSSTSPALNLYRYDRNTVSFGMAYQLRPAVSLTLDIANLFNEPQRLYVGTPDRMQNTIINFVTITAGISGRF